MWPLAAWVVPEIDELLTGGLQHTCVLFEYTRSSTRECTHGGMRGRGRHLSAVVAG